VAPEQPLRNRSLVGDVHGDPFEAKGLILESPVAADPRPVPPSRAALGVYSWRSAVVTSWLASRRGTAPDSRISVRSVAVHGKGGS
jgi:hypothetical protein